MKTLWAFLFTFPNRHSSWTKTPGFKLKGNWTRDLTQVGLKMCRYFPLRAIFACSVSSCTQEVLCFIFECLQAQLFQFSFYQRRAEKGAYVCDVCTVIHLPRILTVFTMSLIQSRGHKMAVLVVMCRPDITNVWLGVKHQATYLLMAMFSLLLNVDFYIV